MTMTKQLARRPLTIAVALAAAGFSLSVLAADVKVTLSGDQEVPPVKTAAKGEGTISVDQLKQFKAGDTYVNVHTAANPGGEIRGQLKPGM